MKRMLSKKTYEIFQQQIGTARRSLPLVAIDFAVVAYEWRDGSDEKCSVICMT